MSQPQAAAASAKSNAGDPGNCSVTLEVTKRRLCQPGLAAYPDADLLTEAPG